MNKIIKNIIFDLDGVLVDACDWHYESLNRALIKNGFDKTKTEVQIMNEQGFYKLYNCGNYKFELMK